MNNRQRSKQATYAEKFDLHRAAKQPGGHGKKDGYRDAADDDDNYVAPAKQPIRKHADSKGDVQSRRNRAEPAFHKDRKNNKQVEVEQVGKMKKFMNLDDIPDYDDLVPQRHVHKASADSRYEDDEEEGTILVSMFLFLNV